MILKNITINKTIEQRFGSVIINMSEIMLL